MRQRKTKYQNNQSGFTLIELMVSITIIGFVSTLGIVNYRNASKASILQLEAYKVAGDIRRAQNMALGAIEFNDAVPAAWGAHFNIANPSQYLIFADVNDDKIYNAGDGVLVTVMLKNNITLDIADAIDVAFVPPDPITYLNGTNSGEANIKLKDQAGNQQEIKVNVLGLIDVNKL